ncbi:MAG TPA: hypothetical protein VKR52_16300, partial [Terracidiphilus sp.]|nr:hypothetical protein [Terracidiphilus sp.]
GNDREQNPDYLVHRATSLGSFLCERGEGGNVRCLEYYACVSTRPTISILRVRQQLAGSFPNL